MTRLCDMRGNRLQPPVGTAVDVTSVSRTTKGEIIHVTAQRVTVKYQPSGPGAKARQWKTDVFRKKDGYIVGGRQYLYVTLKGEK